MKLSNKTIIFFICVCSFCLFISANEAVADEININIVTDIIQKFKENTSSWYGKLLNLAKDVFALVILFEFLWTGTKAVIQQMPIKDLLTNLVMVILSATVFYAIINNYQDWTQAIIGGLSNTATEMVGGEFRADNPFLLGIKLQDKISKIISDLSVMNDLGLIIALYAADFIIIIIFALITSRVIVIYCENLIGLIACVLIVPFGASQMFREYTINVIRYAVSVGFKLFTMSLICGVGYMMFNDFEFSKGVGELKSCMILIASSMVLLAITFTLPDTIASLISSAHGSAGGMLQAYNTVANTVTAGMATAGAAYNIAKGITTKGYKMGMQASRARSLAKEMSGDAWKGMGKGAKAWNTAKAWNSGRQQASMNRSSIHNELKNMRLEYRHLREQK